MKYLTVNDLLYINKMIIQESGGSLGVRDLGLIDSAVNRAQATFDGNDLYGTLFDKSAAIFHSVILNHAFVDGNKRTAVAAAAQLLFINGFELLTSNNNLENFTMQIVAEKLSIEMIAG